eukprot:5799404-Heterocapsa_arctica.AAC.1
MRLADAGASLVMATGCRNAGPAAKEALPAQTIAECRGGGRTAPVGVGYWLWKLRKRGTITCTLSAKTARS